MLLHFMIQVVVEHPLLVFLIDGDCIFTAQKSKPC